MSKTVCVTITCIPPGWIASYFEWFLLGFYQLEEKNEIQVRFELPFREKLLLLFQNEHVNKVLSKIGDKIRKGNQMNLKGYVICGGQKYNFCIDCSDSPFIFSESDLDSCDKYFKMQCPTDLQGEGFSLTHEVLIPWLDVELLNNKDKTKRKQIQLIEEYKHKISPLMVGPRKLSFGLKYKNLRKGYEKYLLSRTRKKEKKVMTYFGGDRGPRPTEKCSNPDFHNEADLMGYFGNQINHPNEKRGKVSKIIGEMRDCDARVINETKDDGKVVYHEDLVVPINDFCTHVSKFEYNTNVSGYRLSIPNRFIESFMVGTGIITDKLHVKWYKGFEEEVIETIEMGYEPMENVDWDIFNKMIIKLPHVDSEKIIERFETKWSPEVVARYIIDSTLARE